LNSDSSSSKKEFDLDLVYDVGRPSNDDVILTEARDMFISDELILCCGFMGIELDVSSFSILCGCDMEAVERFSYFSMVAKIYAILIGRKRL
jgi:hypothetical protein